ncbi:hypothetical protein [Pseudoalteromonas ostreae]|uniref:hypothetical protein n=1 Tax=Pseudoalteromonas ostreae TaxID=2774154 RepID=UPI001B39B060|nr:hypothetical protein [Pseudoalteromonas ostreae]
MNIFEMVRNGELNVLSLVIPLQMIILVTLCYFFAKSKNKNTLHAIIFGLIPGLNCVMLLYYIVVPKEKVLKT